MSHVQCILSQRGECCERCRFALQRVLIMITGVILSCPAPGHDIGWESVTSAQRIYTQIWQSATQSSCLHPECGWSCSYAPDTSAVRCRKMLICRCWLNLARMFFVSTGTIIDTPSFFQIRRWFVLFLLIFLFFFPLGDSDCMWRKVFNLHPLHSGKWWKPHFA